jgi:hypothetical protein
VDVGVVLGCETQHMRCFGESGGMGGVCTSSC